MEQEKIEAIIEAVLFTMGQSVEAEKLSEIVEIPLQEMHAIMTDMMKKYEQSDRGIAIIALEDSYQMCTKGEYYEYLIKVAKTPRKHVLTDTLLETLAIIAYKQPVTRIEIEKIRGVSCDHAVNRLLEFNLIEEVGRMDAPGRPLLFGTTEEFLRSFGVASKEDLPNFNPAQIADFQAEAEAEISYKLDV